MAYAHEAVSSLKLTIERLTNPEMRKSVHEMKKVLEDILKRLDVSSKRSKKSVIDVLDPSIDAYITEAACKLKDFLESYSLHHYLPPSDESFPTIEEEIHSFMQSVKEHFKSTMVGLLDQFKELKGKLLLDRNPDLKAVSLLGMAGIGKTRLANEIYEHPFTCDHFLVRVWVTLGPENDTEKAMVDIASQIEHQLGKDYKKHDSCGDNIHKNLFGRRYFIVLDDIWSGQAYRDLKMWFPDQSRGSRLLLTSRLEGEVQFATKYCVHQRLLNHEESWNLLCQNVFGEDQICPDDLEKSGRKIADRCEGLPLLIIEVAHCLLSGGKMTQEFWNEVANKQTSKVFAEAYDKISEVLLSSYEYLPKYLKSCFLYMGAFPQNCEIPLPKLINLWTVDDFLEPNRCHTNLQDFGIECLEKLVSHSLVFIRKDSSNSRIKSSKLHSTYWHLCVMEARKDKFMNVLITFHDELNEHMNNQPRLSVQNNILFGLKEVNNSTAAASETARSLLCTGQYLQYPVPICLDHLKLLEVLDALAIRFYEFPDEVVNMIQLKYLALTHDGNLPSFISKLQNLQSLIVRQHHSIKSLRNPTCLPKEIWEMQELRHLRITESNLPNPSNEAQLPNLLTLHVKGHSCNKDVFRSTPKLKKLGIKIVLQPRSNEVLNCFEHISILSELESLKCVVVNPRLRSQAVAPPNPQSGFPTSLNKMCLNGIGYAWEHMRVIGSLPHLQVLKLRRYAFRGPKWETKDDEFPKLEFLLLEDIDLLEWTTENDKCFPCLKRLIIRHCYKLEKIPSEIGAISTLEKIEVVDCMPSVVDSAREIKEEEDDNRGDPLPVPITSSWNNR